MKAESNSNIQPMKLKRFHDRSDLRLYPTQIITTPENGDSAITYQVDTPTFLTDVNSNIYSAIISEVYTTFDGTPTTLYETGIITVVGGKVSTINGIPTNFGGQPTTIFGVSVTINDEPTYIFPFQTFLTTITNNAHTALITAKTTIVEGKTNSVIETGIITVVGGTITTVNGVPTVFGGTPTTIFGLSTNMAGTNTVVFPFRTIVSGTSLLIFPSETIITATPTVVFPMTTIINGVATLIFPTETIISGEPSLVLPTPPIPGIVIPPLATGTAPNPLPTAAVTSPNGLQSSNNLLLYIGIAILIFFLIALLIFCALHKRKKALKFKNDEEELGPQPGGMLHNSSTRRTIVDRSTSSSSNENSNLISFNNMAIANEPLNIRSSSEDPFYPASENATYGTSFNNNFSDFSASENLVDPELVGGAYFSNFIPFQKKLEKIPSNKTFESNFANASVINDAALASSYLSMQNTSLENDESHDVAKDIIGHYEGATVPESPTSNGTFGEVTSFGNNQVVASISNEKLDMANEDVVNHSNNIANKFEEQNSSDKNELKTVQDYLLPLAVGAVSSAMYAEKEEKSSLSQYEDSNKITKEYNTSSGEVMEVPFSKTRDVKFDPASIPPDSNTTIPQEVDTILSKIDTHDTSTTLQNFTATAIDNNRNIVEAINTDSKDQYFDKEANYFDSKGEDIPIIVSSPSKTTISDFNENKISSNTNYTTSKNIPKNNLSIETKCKNETKRDSNNATALLSPTSSLVSPTSSNEGIKNSYESYVQNQIDEADLSVRVPPPPTDFVAAQPYFPIRPDEIHMQVGDLVGIERIFSDNWARGQNMSQGKKRGLFPLSILTPIKSGPSQNVVKSKVSIFGGSLTAKTSNSRKNSSEVRYSEKRKTNVIPVRTTSLPGNETLKEIEILPDLSNSVKKNKFLSRSNSIKTIGTVKSKASINSITPSKELIVYQDLQDTVWDISQKSRLNFRSFVRRCRMYSKDFDIKVFLENLSNCENIREEAMFKVIKSSGINNLDDRTFNDLLITIGGDDDKNTSMLIFKHLRNALRDLGVDQFLEANVDVATESKYLATSQDFITKVHLMGNSSSFNLPAFVNSCMNINPDFDFRTFLKIMVEKSNNLDNDTIYENMKDCGVLVSKEEYHEIISLLCVQDDIVLEVIKQWIEVVSVVGISRFIETIDTFYDDEEDDMDAIVIESFLTSVACLSSQSTFALREFVTQSLELNSNFNFETFLNYLLLSDTPANDEEFLEIFKNAGLVLDITTYKRLMITLCGDYELRFTIISHLKLLLKQKGVKWFISRIFSTIQERSLTDMEGRSLLTKIYSISSTATFDYRGFLDRCRRYSSTFDIKIFLNELAFLEESVTDANIKELFVLSGWDISDEEYVKVLRELCGNFNLRLKIVEEWKNYLNTNTPKYFIKYIFIWLEERESAEFALKQFFLKLQSYGDKVQFNLNEFLLESRKHSNVFELRIFLEILNSNVKSIGEITTAEVVKTFQDSGLNILETEAIQLIVILFKDYNIGLEVLKDMINASKMGISSIEHLLMHYYSWISIVREFYIRIRTIGEAVKFDLHSFISVCNTLESSKFNLSKFLGNFVLLEVENLNVLTLLNIFKQSGLENLNEEDYRTIVETLCGDYNSHLSVFREWLITLKECGVDTFVRINFSYITLEGSLNQLDIKTLIKIFFADILSLGGRFNIEKFCLEAKTFNPSFNLKLFLESFGSNSSFDSIFFESKLTELTTVQKESLFLTLFGLKNKNLFNTVQMLFVTLIRTIGVETIIKEIPYILNLKYNSLAEVIFTETENLIASRLFFFKLKYMRNDSVGIRFQLLNFYNICKKLNTKFQLIKFLRTLELFFLNYTKVQVDWILAEIGLENISGSEKVAIFLTLVEDYTKMDEFFHNWGSAIFASEINVYLNSLKVEYPEVRDIIEQEINNQKKLIPTIQLET